MLDITKIRNNPELIKKILIKRGEKWSKNIDEISKLDREYCSLLNKIEKLKAWKNNASNEIAQLIKENKQNEIEKLKEKITKIKDEIINDEEKIKALKEEIKNSLMIIPNLPHESVPYGIDEKDNQEIKKWSTPTKFTFAPKSHWELGIENNLIDFVHAVKLTGTRFTCYLNYGAKLLRALIQYTLDMNSNAGFVEFLPSVILNNKSLLGTGQLPKFEQDLFKLTNGYYLSPTAECQLTNYYSNEILKIEQLPIQLTANTCCFRSEAGSAGKDTKGVIRQHQFYKTEMVILSKPNESYTKLEFLTKQAEKILESLNLPYRRIILCSGDMGFSSAKTYDLEVWLPSYNSYKEISSCSNCEDFQARRMMLRFKDIDKKNKYVHTLNGSGLAIDRLWAAVVENYQQSDGSIKIPEPLQPYLNGLKIIKK